MSLLVLPFELKLIIANLLNDDVDKNCLRLTCRQFYFSNSKAKDILSPSDSLSSSSASSSSSDLPLLESLAATERRNYDLIFRKDQQKFEFLDRLFRPGNIYHASKKAICAMCKYVRPKSCFKQSNLNINGRDVCLQCTLSAVSCGSKPGSLITYCGKKYVICDDCDNAVPAENGLDDGLRRNVVPEGFTTCLRCTEHHRFMRRPYPNCAQS